jgi:hypothetical protein
MEYRKYANNSQIMKAVLDYRKNRGLQDYEVVSLHLHGESLTTWMVGYRKGDNNVRVTVEIKPNVHVPGYHAETHEFWGIQDVEGIIKGYPVEFEKLHSAFPDCEIVFLDNEDDEDYAFGYAALRNTATGQWPQWRIVGWVQATLDNDEDNSYIANAKLPFHEVVTDRETLEWLNDANLEQALRNR